MKQDTIGKLDFSKLTPELFDEYLERYKIAVKELNNALAALPSEDLSWSTFIQPSLDLENSLQCDSVIMNMDNFHTDKAIREKCSNICTEASKFDIDQSMRRDVFAKFKHYYENQFNSEKARLTDEQKYFIEKEMKHYRMSGLELSDEHYEKVKDLDKRNSEISNKFSLNLNNENETWLMTKEDLTGMDVVNDGKWLTDKKQDDDTYKVSLKYPYYIPLMEYCSNRETRKKMSMAFMTRCKIENTPLCSEAFKLKNDKAKLFNFTRFSDYKLQKQMANNTESVMKFINSLIEKSTPLLKSDLADLLSIATKDGVDQIQVYDVPYYSRIHTEKECQLNKESLKQYFSLETVTNGMFEIYQKLLGFKFVNITEAYKHTLWQESVTLYRVDDSDTDKTAGYFYLDLFPRDGKYGHAAVFPIIRQSELNYPVSIMACNFTKDSNLAFDEVETYFHEFGHVMHGMSSKTSIASLAGTTCERDFVEMPSQMFEEWCYRHASLKIMAPSIPEEIVEKLNKSRNMLQGLFIKRQLVFSLFDMSVRGDRYDEPCDKLFNTIYKNITGFELDDSISFPASFGHLMGGYDAGYYGYMWALVFAKDCFTSFKGRETDPVIGKRFKETVLSYGSSRPSIDSLREFLGREPSDDAFIESLFN